MNIRLLFPSIVFVVSCTKNNETGSISTQMDTAGLSQADPAGLSEVVPLDLTDADAMAMAFAKTRGSLNPEEEVIYYWTGLMYNRPRSAPEEFAGFDYGSPMMRFEGFNIARFEPVSPGVFDMVTREINVYQNLNGDIIDCWYNGNIGAENPKPVPVVHVQNDPVNFQISGADAVEMGEHIIFPMEVVISYDSPLPIDDYAIYSAGNTYESTELFNFYTTRTALENPKNNSVPAHISWSRVGQYLPWMQAGQLDGNLVYHAQGMKLENGWDDLPEHLQDWVLEHAPEYRNAPTSIASTRNMTSWRYFKKLVDEGTYTGSCDQ